MIIQSDSESCSRIRQSKVKNRLDRSSFLFILPFFKFCFHVFTLFISPHDFWREVNHIRTNQTIVNPYSSHTHTIVSSSYFIFKHTLIFSITQLFQFFHSCLQLIALDRRRLLPLVCFTEFIPLLVMLHSLVPLVLEISSVTHMPWSPVHSIQFNLTSTMIVNTNMIQSLIWWWTPDVVSRTVRHLTAACCSLSVGKGWEGRGREEERGRKGKRSRWRI